jgi:hypothetical protein
MHAETTGGTLAQPKCGAKLRNGTGVCGLPSGWGTDHGPRGGVGGFGYCKLHGGSTRTQLLQAATLEAEALSQRVMGAAIHLEPDEALQYCIDRTYGDITYCDRRIAELEDTDAAIPTSSERLHEELDRDGQVHELRDRTAESTALLNIWISTRQAAVDRLARYAKWSIDCGLAERQVLLDERQTGLIAGALLAVVGQLGSLSDDDRARVPILLAEHVGRLVEPAIEGSVA